MEEILGLTMYRQSYHPTGTLLSSRSALLWGSTTRWNAFSWQASSLYSLIADEHLRRTSPSCDTWRLIGSQTSLQSRWNQEGFNVVGSGDIYLAKARKSTLGNNEKDYRTCDSKTEFGTWGRGETPIHHDTNTCGNEASQRHFTSFCNLSGLEMEKKPLALIVWQQQQWCEVYMK